jgi:putative transposase
VTDILSVPCGGGFPMAVQQTGRLPEVFNTHQGSQFTSQEWTGELTRLGIAISMDGKHQHGWEGSLYGQRVHRTAQAQREARGHVPEGIREPACTGCGPGGVVRYNAWRPHEAPGNRTPSEAHAGAEMSASAPAKEELVA